MVVIFNFYVLFQIIMEKEVSTSPFQIVLIVLTCVCLLQFCYIYQHGIDVEFVDTFKHFGKKFIKTIGITIEHESTCPSNMTVYIDDKRNHKHKCKMNFSAEISIHEAKTALDESLQLDDRKKILSVVRRISENESFVIVAFINKAYLPFAYSWLCNTKYMGIHDKLLIITSDSETETEFKKKHPDIATVSICGFNITGNQVYMHVGYVRIGIKRTHILNIILQSDIGIFLIEFDCLWVRNPIPVLTKYVDHDLVLTPVAKGRNKNAPAQFAIGFYYMAPTTRMMKLWQELTTQLTFLDAKLRKLPPYCAIPERHNDQRYFITLVNDRYADVQVQIMNWTDFPDGQWYKLPYKNRNLKTAYIVNNNFIQGNQAKINRAKRYGHWFLKDDGSCDDRAVKKIVRS